MLRAQHPPAIGLLGCLGEPAPRGQLVFSAIHVISRERRGLEALEKLNLKHHQPVIPKRGLESGQVVFPHPNESLGGPEPLFQMRCLFEHRDDLIAIGKKIVRQACNVFSLWERRPSTSLMIKTERSIAGVSSDSAGV